MDYKQYRQIKAIEQKNKEKWLQVNPTLTDDSGIYILTRKDENDIRYAYIGQAKHILTRLAQHLAGYQHIDLSLRKHGLYTDDNVNGWTVSVELCGIDDLDAMEKYLIKRYADGYQLRNKTAGGQGDGKTAIADQKPSKGYYDGKAQGYEDARKFIAKLFESNLVAIINGKETVNKVKALEKFKAFIREDNGNV